MRSIIPFPFTIILTLCICVPVDAQAQKLKVGVAGSPPFAIIDATTPTGISVKIWQEIANAERLDYELVPQRSVAAGITAVSEGKLDILIGPISITPERLKKTRFTQPYFIAEVGLLVSSQQPSFWSYISPFFHLAVLSSLGILLISLFAVGNLLWLAERQQNTQHFPKEYWPGIGNGMWFAIVTMTTVGYGDRIPITKAGRIIACLWMLVTMFSISSLTAVLASTFTLALSQQKTEFFNRPADIQKAQIAVVQGTTGEEWSAIYKARLIRTETLNDAINRVLSGQAQGVVFDSPALQYYLYRHPELSLQLSSVSFASEYYGFAVNEKYSSLVDTLNVRLLEMRENGEIKDIEDKWLQNVLNSDF